MSTNLAGIWERLPNEQTTLVKSRALGPNPGLHTGKDGAAIATAAQRRDSSSSTTDRTGSPRSSIASSISSTPPVNPSPTRPPVSLPLASGLVFDPSQSPGGRPSPKSLYPDTGVFSGLAFLAGREKDFGVQSFSSAPAGPNISAPSPAPGAPAPQPQVSAAGTPTPTAAALVSPPLPQEPEHEHTQLALAEIFAGNPRPHFRSQSSSQNVGYSSEHLSPRPGNDLPLSPLGDTGAARSYFSPPLPQSSPTPTRARSLSSAPVLDRSGIPVPRSPPTSMPYGLPRSSSQAPSIPADQYGYRPSSSVSNHYSSSLPSDPINPIQIGGTTPSAAQPTSTPFRDDHSPSGVPRHSSFSTSSYTGSGALGGGGGAGGGYDPTTGWRSSGTSRQAASFSAWEEAEREGRSRARDEPSRPWGERDASSSSAGTGIGVSNMSPFSRDGGRMLPDVGDGASVYRSRREYSLGAVGSGRKRGDSVWGSSRTLKEDDEDADDAFAPTRSGATSRRHSFAAFEPPSRSQIGFTLPDEGRHNGDFLSANGNGNGMGRGLSSRQTFTTGSSAINDDDLAADLNSLHLNLEAHAAATESSSPSRSLLHVGSVPSNFPQGRPFDSTLGRSPPVSLPFSPPSTTTDPFAPNSSASRFFQPPNSNANGVRGSRFEFGGGSASSPSQTNDYAQGAFSTFNRNSQQSSQSYMPSFGLPPPSPPHSFYSPTLPSGHGLSAQAPPFQSFTPTPSNQQQQQQFYPQSAGPASNVGGSGHDLTNLGRGIPLHTVPANAPLYIVEFKAGRKDLFFVEDPNLQLRQGDLVIVEADRGKDIGKFFKPCSIDEVQAFQQRLVEMALGQLANPGGAAPPNPASIARMTKEFSPKKIFGKAQAADTQMLLSKAQDEVKALQLIRTKVAQKNLPMEVCDAEWQWDRRKLTFYFTLLPGHTRVDFRELVRELFRIFKTRLWLCSLDQQASTWDFK
ncbi:hypothetical protein MNV49_004218 [Pseudohyphozyma bogoriensis]|nr:hypothetical protein MNV49_004218 [Pseudohyphozyma bogoriensis]